MPFHAKNKDENPCYFQLFFLTKISFTILDFCQLKIAFIRNITLLDNVKHGQKKKKNQGNFHLKRP